MRDAAGRPIPVTQPMVGRRCSVANRSRDVSRRHMVESMRFGHEEFIPEGECPFESPLRGNWTPPNPSMMRWNAHQARRFCGSTFTPVQFIWITIVSIAMVAFFLTALIL